MLRVGGFRAQCDGTAFHLFDEREQARAIRFLAAAVFCAKTLFEHAANRRANPSVRNQPAFDQRLVPEALFGLGLRGGEPMSVRPILCQR
jgi:hypothetical protein